LGERITIGRAPENDLTYPADHRLSREHMELLRTEKGWLVRDLNSRNGTYVNGRRIAQHLLVPGDRVAAGELCLWLEGSPAVANETITTLDSSLQSELVPSHPVAERHIRALVRAGRELAGVRPTEEFFEWTLALAIEAVQAERGAIAVLDDGEWTIRSRRGDLTISSTVRDRIASERVSMLVRDAGMDQLVAEAQSIIVQQIRSLMAAPLQTGERVLGLIYVDRTHAAGFTPQDLNLLTILANISAIRLEHGRLAELEEAKRARIRQMEAEADAQRRALQAAELLRHAETRAVLAETAASMAKLAAAVSHDLNTPLGALKSSVDTLLGAIARARQGADVERALTVAEDLSASIKASTGRLSEIIGRLQRFTNLDRAEVQSIELGQFLRDVVDATQASAHERVEIKMAGTERVISRPQQLAAAFAALFEHCPGRVQIRSTRGSRGVEVALHAPELIIPQDDLTELFDPAFRIVEGRMRTGNWSLFSARQLVRELGGDVQAESSAAAGSVFTVLIPSQPSL
jgi:K+-sensing histidine kinase KdpD